jgi:hypothetical protein
MSTHWISGKDVIDRWSILPFELFEYCKQGLQPYNKFGIKIVDIDPLIKNADFTYEDVEKSVIRWAKEKVFDSYGMVRPDVIKRTRFEYEARLKEAAGISSNAVLKSFTIPSEENEAEKVIQDIFDWQFKMGEVEEFEKLHNIQISKSNNHNAKKTHRVDPKVADLICEAKPEIEMIYEAIKRIGFSGRKFKLEIELQSVAINEFRKKEKKFKIIKENYLKDKGIFIVNASQPKRDFISRLLHKIVKDNGLGVVARYKLFATYKSTK